MLHTPAHLPRPNTGLLAEVLQCGRDGRLWTLDAIGDLAPDTSKKRVVPGSATTRRGETTLIGAESRNVLGPPALTPAGGPRIPWAARPIASLADALQIGRFALSGALRVPEFPLAMSRKVLQLGDFATFLPIS